jgi:hypothetical protein
MLIDFFIPRSPEVGASSHSSLDYSLMDYWSFLPLQRLSLSWVSLGNRPVAYSSWSVPVTCYCSIPRVRDLGSCSI